MIKKTLETQFSIRCSNKLREDAENSAYNHGQSLQEWVRRAMVEKLERESSDYKDSIYESLKSLFYDQEFKTYLKSIFKSETEDKKKDMQYAVFIKDDLKEILYDPEFKKYLKDNIEVEK